MNTSLSALSYYHHPALTGLEPAQWARVEADAEHVSYEVGDVLCQQGTIPQRVLLLLSGEARLLGFNGARPVTLAKLKAGDFVGLASLLRAEACEEVTTSQPVTALALPDHIVVELLLQAPGFQNWCSRTVFAAEVAALFPMLTIKSGDAADDLRSWLARVLPDAEIVPLNPSSPAVVSEDRLVVMGSANSSKVPLGSAVNLASSVPQTNPPLPLRLISLKRSGLRGPTREVTKQDAALPGLTTDQNKLEREGEESTLKEPLASTLNLGQADSASNLRLVRASGAIDETLACFQMLGQLLNLPFRRDAIDKAIRDRLRRGQQPSIPLMGQLAAGMGLHVVAGQVPGAMACRVQTPALLQWNGAFVLAVKANADGLTIASPREGWLTLSPNVLEEHYPEGAEFLLVDRTTATPNKTFGFSWFLPSLRRYRGVLIQVLVASFVVQLFSLANPLLIQVIIDKVIAQRSLATLQVLGIALVIITLLEGVITSLRTFLFTETTNRIDTRLGAEVIDHLLRLPLSYFDQRPVGELGTRVAELEKIRNFLTGTALTTILDAAFSLIYIVVMLYYSLMLTVVSLAVIPIQIVITILGAPLFRRQYRQAAEDNAKTQSHLVEVLSGVQTVKAQNVEMVSRWKWQEFYNQYISHSFEKTITATTVSQTSQVLQKLSQLLVLWVGATLVLNGELTLGQLIAFRIISSYVTQPLLRLSSIWQNIQEIKVSFERLADVIDTPEESTEADKANIPLPPLEGHVRFEDISFAFAPGSPLVLKNVNLDIPAGSFVGVVGQSGSGKSTLMKLLPRLYMPSTGRILIDGIPIDKVELYSLRRQVGIVPQDPLLFSGTVAENIALADPEATNDAIIEAAKIADAHNFIMELPAGYSTQVGERGGLLSGGQRQRLAIARTLLNRPKLLIMDEATSALDFQTENRVCNNLHMTLKGCTVFFITHRLPSVQNADRIVMLNQGSIAEQGSHDDLIALRGRYYAMYRQQEGIN